MSKKITVKKENKTLTMKLLESPKKGMNWLLPSGSDGYHFKSLDSVKKHLEEKTGGEIEIK